MKEVLAKTGNLTETEWLNLRKQGLGGSDAAAACGLSKFKTPLALWLEKTGQKETEPAGEAACWGKLLEPVIREEFARRSGFNVTTVPFLFRRKEYPFMLANIDGVIKTDKETCLFETKTANAYSVHEWEDGLPQEYYLQIQHYLAVCDLAKAYVVVLTGGNTLKSHEISRDEEAIAVITALEQNFWQRVINKTPPDVSAKDGELLNNLFPESKAASMLLGPEADELAEEYFLAKAREEAAKNDKALAENRLKELLQDKESGKTPSGCRINWKTVKSCRLDSTKLKTEQPDVYKQYTTESQCRKFSITGGNRQ